MKDRKWNIMELWRREKAKEEVDRRKAVAKMKRMKIVIGAAAIVLGMIWSTGTKAQEEVSGPVPWVSMIQGDNNSLYVKQSDTDWFTATPNTPLGEGDQVFQDKGGRSEIYIGRGTYVRLDENTGVIFDQLNNQQVRVILTKGQAEVGNGGSSDFLLDTPGQTVAVERGSKVKVAVNDDGDSEITVKRGRARVNGGSGSVRVERGQRLTADANGGLGRLDKNPKYDGFDRFSDGRESALAAAAAPPTPVVGYMPEPVVSDLSGNGVWVNDPSYGWVWRPRVAVGWAPYRVGRWVHRPVWGWTWVSYEPWGWYPYHYGRWVTVGGGWAWAPVSVQVGWSPALVFWVQGPDYIAWQPIPYGVSVTAVYAMEPAYLYSHYVCVNCITVVRYADFGRCDYGRYARPWRGDCGASCRVVRYPDHGVRHSEFSQNQRTPRPDGYVSRGRMPAEHRVYAHQRDAQPRQGQLTSASRVQYGNAAARPMHDPGRNSEMRTRPNSGATNSPRTTSPRGPNDRTGAPANPSRASGSNDRAGNDQLNRGTPANRTNPAAPGVNRNNQPQAPKPNLERSQGSGPTGNPGTPSTRPGTGTRGRNNQVNPPANTNGNRNNRGNPNPQAKPGNESSVQPPSTTSSSNRPANTPAATTQPRNNHATDRPTVSSSSRPTSAPAARPASSTSRPSGNRNSSSNNSRSSNHR